MWLINDDSLKWWLIIYKSYYIIYQGKFDTDIPSKRPYNNKQQQSVTTSPMAAEGGSLPSPTIKTNSNYIAVQPAAPQQQPTQPTQQQQQRIQASPQRIINQQGQQVLFINNDIQQHPQPQQSQTNTAQRTTIVPRTLSTNIDYNL